MNKQSIDKTQKMVKEAQGFSPVPLLILYKMGNNLSNS
jgi:hypothetical protein